MGIDYRKEYYSLLKQTKGIKGRHPKLTEGHYYEVECTEEENNCSLHRLTVGNTYIAKYENNSFVIGVGISSSPGGIEYSDIHYNPSDFRVVGFPTRDQFRAIKELDKLINGLRDFARSYHG